jgi:hypothetical protein
MLLNASQEPHQIKDWTIDMARMVEEEPLAVAESLLHNSPSLQPRGKASTAVHLATREGSPCCIRHDGRTVRPPPIPESGSILNS